MEDDDEFGDLYTDILTPFSSSTLSALHQQTTSSTTPPVSCPIDIKLQSKDADSSNSKFTSSFQNQTPNTEPQKEQSDTAIIKFDDSRPSSKPVGVLEDQLESESKELAWVSERWGVDSGNERNGSRVLEGGDVKLGIEEDDGGGFVDRKDGEFVSREEKFGIEEEDEDNRGMMGDLDAQPMIPGLGSGPFIQGISDKSEENQELGNSIQRDDVSGAEGDDWDSDSEDDLQIVLNDNNHGPMGMERNNGLAGCDDDEDEDGDPLVIVADNNAAHQPTEEQEWGEDTGQVADGERKETTEAGKPNGGVAVAPKLGYSNFGYHPYHSQFKYVRPGAAPLPGVPPIVPGGAPGQVRPPVNIANAGRGRGDWRPTGLKGAPSMQKGFHPGLWGSNMLGRGFGGGLEFTLPSHKTIFEVDIDSFEEKPWKYPGVDVSHFFNFGLSEESWKEYCKQLEQLRLESTMQSRISVLSGRAEQVYDPDLPPELAAAAAGRDPSAENANALKADGGLNDSAKGTARGRPPLPMGRAIPTVGGYGERLPSGDTRPPRYRDSDAIIEIVLHDSMEDASSIGDAVPEQTDPDNSEGDKMVDVTQEDSVHLGNEYFDGYPCASHGTKRGDMMKSSPPVKSLHDEIREEERDSPSLRESIIEYHTSSRGQSPAFSAEDGGTSYEDRKGQTKGRATENSLVLDSDGGNRKSHDGRLEESIETMNREHTPESFSPAPSKGRSFEEKVASDDESVSADGKPGREKEEINSIRVASDNTSRDKNKLHSTRTQKTSSQVEPSSAKGTDDGGGFRVGRSSEHSTATGSSRDHERWSDGVDEEVLQDDHSAYRGDLKRRHSQDGHGLRRKDHDGQLEAERSYMVAKSRADPRTHRDWVPYNALHFHEKAEGLARRKERDYSDGTWQWRDDDQHSRRVRAEDTRKHELADEMVSRLRGKMRECDKVEQYLRRPIENGSSRGYDKDMHYREKDDNLKSRYENMDDLQNNRRKDDDHVRRDHVIREENSNAHRETSSRRKRERDESLDQRKRDDQPRRDSTEDHHSVRHNDEAWFQRDRAERHRDGDEWHRSRQSYGENLSRREREDGRGSTRIVRNVDEKAWVSHSRVKDECKGYDKDSRYKDAGRHGEPLKRKERVEDESILQLRASVDAYARGSNFSTEEKRSKQERLSVNDRSVHATDSQRLNEKKHKECSRKVKESEGDHRRNSVSSKKHQEERSSANEMAGVKDMNEKGNNERESSAQHRLTKEHREDVASDDEQQGSKRGRSKLQRWTSHKERTFLSHAKSSSSLQVKVTDRENGGGSASATQVSEKSSRKIEGVDNIFSVTKGKDAGGTDSKDATDSKPLEDRRLDTVAKLKKRSERFKLPMPSEKDPQAIKKVESEPLPSQGGTPANSEVKQERPARKRRWVGS